MQDPNANTTSPSGSKDVVVPPGAVLEPGSLGIHTSDRALFKRCRRKWSWSSPVRRGLVPIGESPTPLWFGSGFHYAMEDYHGYQIHGNDPKAGLAAYVRAQKSSDLPGDYAQAWELGNHMLDHYVAWLQTRNRFRTYWVDGVPQVEVNFAVPLGPGYHYAGTFDRIVIDEEDRFWILDYKTAARFDTSKLEMDPQVSAYVWAAEQLYPDLHFEGMVYQQHLKGYPKPPRQLQSGEFSVDKKQQTTYKLFRRALVEAGHKSVSGKYREMLEFLALNETPEMDKFIRRDLVRRNDAHKDAAYAQIMMELQDMADPDLRIYPNPTKDCVWDCAFKSACLATDDGSDPDYLIETGFVERRERESWRRRMRQQMEYDQAEAAGHEHGEVSLMGSRALEEADDAGEGFTIVHIDGPQENQ